jgi:hypothetical protein
MVFPSRFLYVAGMSFALLAAAVPSSIAAEADEFSLASPGPELSDGVFSLRVFTARKGSFEEMLRLTQVFIAPYYEKLGVRYVGFWKQIEAPGHAIDPDHDVIHMLTRYESVEHWQATRAPWAWGETDEAFVRMANAMFERQSYAVEQEHFFFTGFVGPTAPRPLPPDPAEPAGSFQADCGGAADLPREPGAAYCSCVEASLPDDGWSRPYFLAWLRAGGVNRPELTPPDTRSIHDGCFSQFVSR